MFQSVQTWIYSPCYLLSPRACAFSCIPICQKRINIVTERLLTSPCIVSVPSWDHRVPRLHSETLSQYQSVGKYLYNLYYYTFIYHSVIYLIYLHINPLSYICLSIICHLPICISTYLPDLWIYFILYFYHFFFFLPLLLLWSSIYRELSEYFPWNKNLIVFDIPGISSYLQSASQLCGGIARKLFMCAPCFPLQPNSVPSL